MHNLLETSAKSAINLDDGCNESVGTTRHCLFRRVSDPGFGLKEWPKHTRGALFERGLWCEVTTCSPPERTNRPRTVGYQ